jgi:hypothetical protein
VEPFDLYRVRGAKRGWVQKHGSRLVEMFRVIDGASIIMALWMAVLQLNLSLRWDFVLIAICTVLL